MKKILFIAFIIISINTSAQITLEHKYDSASTISSNVNNGLIGQLMIVNFEVSGERYVIINRMGKYISIYDMNHSLLKKIDCSGFPVPPNNLMGSVLYLSENLFNNDSKIEFMYLNATQTSYYTGIYNEDGTLLFSDTGAAMIKENVPLQQYPIYNTTHGTKMILSYMNGEAKVFSLPGTLTTAIKEANNSFIAMQSSVSNAYPNPTNNTTQVDYTLPVGINEGEIVFYNLQGTEVKRFKVDRTFNTLLVSTKEIAAGTYYYQLQTTDQNSEGKKMVVIK